MSIIKQKLLNATAAYSKLLTLGIGLAITMAVGIAIGMSDNQLAICIKFILCECHYYQPSRCLKGAYFLGFENLFLQRDSDSTAALSKE